MSNFDKLHHICIVVHDIDKAQAYYESIGIGPWEAYPPLAEYEELEGPSREGFMAMQYRICNLQSPAPTLPAEPRSFAAADSSRYKGRRRLPCRL